MIDTHSHVLPQMDDGSRSVEQSLQMLSALSAQGVTTVAATPHFYASALSPEEFFERRQAAAECLQAVPLPVELRLGAEVLYFEGIRHFSALKDFCIAGTELLLLELPFAPWSDRTVQDLVELSTEGEFTLLLAHIDRYLAWQPVSLFEMLASRGVLMQMNAAAFLDWRMRNKALRLLKNGLVQFIGSDCHDMEERAPNLGEAFAFLEKKLGTVAVSEFQAAEAEWFRSEVKSL